MATPGRKPKPTQMHILNGNPSKIRIEDRISNEVKMKEYGPGEFPPAPEWLDAVAKEEWNRVAPMLSSCKLLTEADTKALEAYCKCWSRYVEAEQQMDEVGSTIFQPNQKSKYVQQLPQVAIAQKYLKLCKDFMTEFGLTPSSRGRILLPGESDEDEMESLFRKSMP